MADLFHTIEAPSEAQYTEKRSKFIAFAFPVQTAAEAKEHVARMQKRYYDARHVCWAYMLGSARTEFQSNDNGEPSGTAGKPILGQINSLGLTNVLVIVVRYFGGIKLGTSGLIVAYRTAARMALEAAEVVERSRASMSNTPVCERKSGRSMSGASAAEAVDDAASIADAPMITALSVLFIILFII